MRRRWIEIGLWMAFVFIGNAIDATSVLMEYARDGRTIAAWKPFVWEYTSGVTILALVPFILAVESRVPITLETWKRAVPIHLLASIPHSLMHVGAMVALRKLIYGLAGETYDFGDVPIELVYEWRKDAFSYFVVLFIVNAYRIYRERSEGEANYVEARAPDPLAALPHFRVTYNRRDFNLDPKSVELIESAGNYVVLHSGSRTYLMRETMKNLEARLAGTSFQRVHRSKMVNLAHAVGVDNQDGRTVLRLDTGAEILVSRSYKPALHSALERSFDPVHPSLCPSTAK